MPKTALKLCLALSLVFLGTEVILRSIGYEPGDLRPSLDYFKPVDSLVIIPDFITNPEGVLIANKTYFNKQGVYINEDGFRTKSFASIDTTKTKLLFIGDSFTWGMSAEPFYKNSFCDLLAQDSSLEIINLGIPAADPVQYAALAQKYIPSIQPSKVFVLFFMGNDLMREDRTNIGQPYYYWTNAGAIYADIDGQHFNAAQSAYDYLIAQKLFLRKPKNAFEWLVSKSAALARLYAVKFRWQEKQAFEQARTHPQVTVKYLNQLAAICKANNSTLHIVVIPETKDAGLSLAKYKTKYAALLNDKNLQAHFSLPQVKPEWYSPTTNPHLNNRGHFEYYQWLKNLTTLSP
jgi:hypothetical protein